MKVLVGNIQRFCLDDGPGIRTTVFLTGCSLRCPWCCNPENLTAEIKTGKDSLVYGKLMDENQIFDEIMKDFVFYDEGGVTFSGGECLLMLPHLTTLLSRLKEKGISIAIETSLFVPSSNLQAVFPYLDFAYVDFKILQKVECMNILNGNLDTFMENLSYLKKKRYLNIVIPRIPLIPGITDTDNNLSSIKDTLLAFELYNIEIFSVHNLAESKYSNLGFEFHKYEKETKMNMDKIASYFESFGIKVLEKQL